MRIFNRWVGVALLLASSMAANAGTVVINLYAGNPKNDAASKVAGTVTITTGNPGSIVFNITKPGYCLTGYHIYVGSQPPSTSAPGQYPYKKELECVTNHTVSPAINIPVGYWVAVHGEVNYGCAASPMPSAASGVCTTDLNPGDQDKSYVNALRLLPATNYQSWCSSTEIGFAFGQIECWLGKSLSANLYSSLAPPPGGNWGSVLKNPVGPLNPNWPAINYLLSKYPNGINTGTTVMCDVQHAIWALLGFLPIPVVSTISGGCVEPPSPIVANINSLITEAKNNAWSIGCKPGGKAALVVVPYGTNFVSQPLMIPTDCKCKDDTIWAIPGLLGTPAYNVVRFSTGWGGYFVMP